MNLVHAQCVEVGSTNIRNVRARSSTNDAVEKPGMRAQRLQQEENGREGSMYSSPVVDIMRSWILNACCAVSRCSPSVNASPHVESRKLPRLCMTSCGESLSFARVRARQGRGWQPALSLQAQPQSIPLVPGCTLHRAAAKISRLLPGWTPGQASMRLIRCDW